MTDGWKDDLAMVFYLTPEFIKALLNSCKQKKIEIFKKE